jgi:hypothetical protein
MTTVQLISETTLKNNSPINLNVEQTLLNLAINEGQETHIQMALGSKLYQKILSIVIDKTIKTDPNMSDYKTLLDTYIAPALIYWSLAECLNYVRFKIMNKGVQLQNSDNSTSPELTEIKYFQQTITNKAEFKQQRLINYLIENQTLFPEYRATLDNDDIAPETNGYFSGMVLDDDYEDLCEKYLGLPKNYRSIL